MQLRADCELGWQLLLIFKWRAFKFCGNLLNIRWSCVGADFMHMDLLMTGITLNKGLSILLLVFPAPHTLDDSTSACRLICSDLD